MTTDTLIDHATQHEGAIIEARDQHSQTYFLQCRGGVLQVVDPLEQTFEIPPHEFREVYRGNQWIITTTHGVSA
jgi:hypothetical protein